MLAELKLDGPETETERAYVMIRHEVVHGILEPGQKLKLSALKDRYQIGVAPLREALSRLTSDKLVFQERQRGFLVAPMSAEEAADVGRVRTLLEVTALKESLAQGDDGWEASVVAAYHRLSRIEQRADSDPEKSRELEYWNSEFHEALIAGTQSKWLLELRRNMYLQHERYRHLSRAKSKGKRDAIAEHKAIFEAAIARDTPTACTLLTEHILNTTETVCAALKEALSPD